MKGNKNVIGDSNCLITMWIIYHQKKNEVPNVLQDKSKRNEKEKKIIQPK